MFPRSKAWRTAAAVAGVLAGLTLIILIAAIQLVTTLPIHERATDVPSIAAGPPAARYTRPVEESRRLARALLVGNTLPGLSVAVAVNGEMVWAEGFGLADPESGTPLTPLTRFRLGALSKPLTAMGAAVLHERGRLDLDAAVQRYVPAYPEKQWTVTTRQLMGDVAGVHRIRGDNNDAMPVDHCASLDESVAMLRDDPLLFEPGTRHRYSIWGWVLVSAAVEGAAAERFDRFMVRQVFEPLAMNRTVVAETDDLDDGPPRHVPPRALAGIRLGAKEAKRPDYSCLAGGGAFLSTPTDLVRLGSAMIKPGFLKAETIAAFHTPTRLTSGRSTTYAQGWTVGTVPIGKQPSRIVSHRGSPMGATVSLLTFPDLGLVVAAAANATHAGGVNAFAMQAAEAFTRR